MLECAGAFFLFGDTMKNAIQIVRDAYAYAGICPTGQPLNADMSREGLDFLNELLYKWNTENYFPFTHNTIDAEIDGTGGAEISPESATFKGEVPAFVQKCFWRNGSVWEPVVRVSYENIWQRRSSGEIPSFFAFTLDSEGKGVILFDCENGKFLCRVIYNRAIPTMDYNDPLNAPPQYEQLLKYGVAYKACVRYGIPADVAGRIAAERDSILDAIKKVNSFKHEVNIGYRRGFRSPAELVNGAYSL